MARRDGGIQTVMSITGEREYTGAIKQAKDNLRVLQSQLKAQTAELGRNASAQDKARVKTENLKKQIEEQKKIIFQMEAELRKAKEQFGEGAAATQRYEVQLNNARTVLARMNDDLSDASKALSDVADAFDNATAGAGESAQQTANFAEGMGKLKDVAVGIGDGIATAFNTTLDTVKEMVEQMIDLMNYAIGSVENWKAITDVFGGDDAEVQKWWLAMSGAGLDPTKMSGSITKVVNAVHGGGQAVQDALSALEITGEDAYGSHFDLWADVITRLGNIEDAGKRQDIMSSLFGNKGWTDVNEILAHWTDMQSYLTTLDGHNAFLSNAEIKMVDDVEQKLLDIETTYGHLKTILGTELIANIQPDGLLTDTNKTLADIIDLFHASTDEERKEAVLKLDADIDILAADINLAITNLSTFMQKISDALSNSESPILRFIGTLTKSLAKMLEWVSENWPRIEAVLEKIFPAIVANKVLEATTGRGLADTISGFGQGAIDLAIVKKLFFSGGANAAKAAAAGTASTGWLTSGLSAIGSGAAALSWLTPGAMVVSQGLSEIQRNERATEALNELKAERDALSTEFSMFESPEKSAWNRVATVVADNARDYAFKEFFDWIESGFAAMAQDMDSADPDFQQLFYGVSDDTWEKYNALIENRNKLGDQALNAFDVADVVTDMYNDMTEYLRQSAQSSMWYLSPDRMNNALSWLNTPHNGESDSDKLTASGIASAVKRALVGVSVKMDGAAVGNIVSQYVADQLGR